MALNVVLDGFKKGTDQQPFKEHTEKFQRKTNLRIPASNVITIKGDWHTDKRYGKPVEDGYIHLTVQIKDTVAGQVYAYFRLRDGTVWNQVHIFSDAEISAHPELKPYEGAYAWISSADHVA